MNACQDTILHPIAAFFKSYIVFSTNNYLFRPFSSNWAIKKGYRGSPIDYINSETINAKANKTAATYPKHPDVFFFTTSCFFMDFGGTTTFFGVLATLRLVNIAIGSVRFNIRSRKDRINSISFDEQISTIIEFLE
jgi:hypothetical protein